MQFPHLNSIPFSTHGVSIRVAVPLRTATSLHPFRIGRSTAQYQECNEDESFHSGGSYIFWMSEKNINPPVTARIVMARSATGPSPKRPSTVIPTIQMAITAAGPAAWRFTEIFFKKSSTIYSHVTTLNGSRDHFLQANSIT